MPEMAYVNGEILPIEKATVPIEDRGYQFGDAIYEVIRIHHGRPIGYEEHMVRLFRSMNEIQMTGLTSKEIDGAIRQLYAKALMTNALLYIQISRGIAPRNHKFPKESPLQVVMTIRSYAPENTALWKEGVRVMTMADIRWARCDVKSVQLLANSMGKQQAVELGFYDAIFISKDGIVREATSSNALIVSEGRIFTHPLNQYILPGVTRSLIKGICNEIGLPFIEEEFQKEKLIVADEVFLTGTTTEVLPVVYVDDRMIGEGKPGPVSIELLEQLRQEFENPQKPKL